MAALCGLPFSLCGVFLAQLEIPANFTASFTRLAELPLDKTNRLAESC